MYQLKKRIGNIISTLLKFALFICFAFPFYWMVTTAFKSYQESIAFPPTLWPHNFSWQAFISVCQKIDIIHYFKNSILVSTAVVILQAFINIPAAYGFARYDFKGKKVKFTGKVVQVIEGSGSIQIRLAVNDNYDTILFGQYDSSIVGSRVLEDDHITIYGTSAGTISYQSTMGGTITIPGVSIEKIDQ